MLQNQMHCHQGGRTWQPFVRSKNGDENCRQAQETLFLTQKGNFFAQRSPKVRKSRQILIRAKMAYVRA